MTVVGHNIREQLNDQALSRFSNFTPNPTSVQVSPYKRDGEYRYALGDKSGRVSVLTCIDQELNDTITPRMAGNRIMDCPVPRDCKSSVHSLAFGDEVSSAHAGTGTAN